MKANGWIDFRPDQAFAPALCDDWSLVNDVPKVLTWAWNPCSEKVKYRDIFAFQ